MELVRPVFLLCFLLIREGKFEFEKWAVKTYSFKLCAGAQWIGNWYLVILNLKYWSLSFGNLYLEYEHLDWQITLRLDWLGCLVFTNRKCFVNSLPPHCLQSIHTDSNKWSFWHQFVNPPKSTPKSGLFWKTKLIAQQSQKLYWI